MKNNVHILVYMDFFMYLCRGFNVRICACAFEKTDN